MKIKSINIQVIPIAEMRLKNGIGDYWYDETGTLQVRISDTGDDTMNRLILIHEIVEEMLSQHFGVDEETIQAFDKDYEEERDLGLHKPEDEPGFDPRSPYKQFHTMATAVEMMLAGFLNIDWKKYESVINDMT